MSLSKDERTQHTNYSEHLHPDTRLAVDVAFKQMYNTLTRRGIKCANDDRAERLVAAITRYICDSDTEVAMRVSTRTAHADMREERRQYAAGASE